MVETVNNSGPTLCVCGHPFLAHQVDYDIRPNCRGGCTKCMCEEFREAPDLDGGEAMSNAAALPKFVTNGEQAMTLCKTCRDPVTITDVNCSKCKTIASDPPHGREITLIGHNLTELTKLSPEARRRVSDYVKRFVDDMEHP